MMENLAARLAQVRIQIETAAEKSGRNASEITLIAVSKTHPANLVREALAAGAFDFGENKVQEAVEKIAEIGRETACWHLIGHLQANKARKAVQSFDVIHTLDSIELAERLERLCAEENRAELTVFAQIDLAGETTKSGIGAKELPQMIDFLQNCKRLKLAGLMTLPPYFENAENVRPFFTELRALRDELLPSGKLSMGMSHDFEIAIEEGATHVRVGTAIFGQRNYSV